MISFCHKGENTHLDQCCKLGVVVVSVVLDVVGAAGKGNLHTCHPEHEEIFTLGSQQAFPHPGEDKAGLEADTTLTLYHN